MFWRGHPRQRLHKWELALLLALSVTLCYSVFALRSQQALAGQLIRLHVVAASDSPEDQALKLQVRDGILATLEPLLEPVSDRAQAAELLKTRLPELAQQASAISGQPATVTLEAEGFPARDYDSFSLPAGEYLSLRVALGEAAGQNWWCVVFPPLCLSAAGEPAVAADSLTGAQTRLITGEQGEYVLRFKVLELLEQARRLLSRPE